MLNQLLRLVLIAPTLTFNAVELSFLRRSGIACPGQGLPGDRRNLGSMDGWASERPCNLDTGIHAGMTAYFNNIAVGGGN